MLVPNCAPTLGVCPLVTVCVKIKSVVLTFTISPAFNEGITYKLVSMTKYRESSIVVPLIATNNGVDCTVTIIDPAAVVLNEIGEPPRVLLILKCVPSVTSTM